MQSFVNILTIMQGIYQGYPVMFHDKAWIVILTLSEDNMGAAHFDSAIEIIENSGQATVVGSAMSLLRKHYQNLKDMK